MENYVTLSLETHLFFARIMKEHSLFLEAGFPCKDESWFNRADWFKQQCLQAGCSLEPDCQSMQTVNQINNRAVCLLNGLIEFKENILREVSNCRLFTANYPLLIKHIIREANHYIRLLKTECED